MAAILDLELLLRLTILLKGNIFGRSQVTFKRSNSVENVCNISKLESFGFILTQPSGTLLYFKHILLSYKARQMDKTQNVNLWSLLPSSQVRTYNSKLWM